MISVLYVDDEPMLLEILKLMLEKDREFRITTLQSAREGLSLLADSRFDAIVSDYQMPGMDGIEFLRRVRAEFAEIPFILFTGRGREEIAIQAFDAGADFYVQKGGEPRSQFAELAHKIRIAVERRRSSESLKESQARLRDSEDLFRQFLNTIPIGVWLSDSTGNLVFGNPAGQQIWGEDPSGNEGNPRVFRAWRYPGRTPLKSSDWALGHAIAEGKTTSDELLEIEAADGSHKYILNWAAPVKNTRGGIIGAFVINQDITDGIRTRIELDRNNSRHETMLEGLPFPMFVIDREHRIVSWNRPLEEFSGLTADIVHGKAEAWRAFYPQARPTLADLVVDGRQGEISRWYSENAGPSILTAGAIEAVTFFPELNGGSHIFLTAAPVRDAAGTVIGAVEVLQDITLKLRVEEELRSTCCQLQAAFEETRRTNTRLEEQNAILYERETRYRNLIETSPDLIWETDAGGVIVFASPQSTRYLGYAPADLTGRPLRSLVRPEDCHLLGDFLALHPREAEPVRCIELPLLHRDGQPVLMEIRSAPVLDSDGTIRGFSGIARDVTAQRGAEAALRESEHRFREIFNKANDAIELHEIDQNGLPSRYVEVNEVACRMLGFTREELLGKGPLDVTSEKFSAPLAEIAGNLHRGGHARFETEHRRKDGGLVPVEINAHTVTIGGRQRVLAVVRDITERKHAEAALRQLQEKMRVLSSITRHDIINKLTAIRGINRALLKKTGASPEHELLEKQELALGALSRQIEFRRQYEITGLESPCWLLAGRVIAEAVRDLPAGGRVRFSIDTGPWEILADTMLKHVFYNLVENALLHGDRVTEIRFSCSLCEDTLVIVCEDNGVGIPTEEKGRILDRGYGKHSGLGLYLAREILAFTGITISETGTYGNGARFELRVPPGAYREFRHQSPADAASVCDSFAGM